MKFIHPARSRCPLPGRPVFPLCRSNNADGCRGRIELKKPRLAEREEILLAHDVDYVDRFLSHQLRDDEIRRIGLRPWKREIVERTMRLVGGAS